MVKYIHSRRLGTSFCFYNKPMKGIWTAAWTAAALSWTLGPTTSHAHGGVVMEDDVCVIKIGFLQAHFTVYQPRTQQREELCEDLPDVTETVFVMEYLHNSLADMPIDFRIIRDVTGRRRFAKWEDVARIENLDEATVLYQPAVLEPDVLSVLHEFDQPGHYIGIVTARQPGTNRTYRAVFPFQVGATGFGYVPLIAAAVILLQINFWIMGGGLGRWRAKRTAGKAASVQA